MTCNKTKQFHRLTQATPLAIAREYKVLSRTPKVERHNQKTERGTSNVLKLIMRHHCLSMTLSFVSICVFEEENAN